MIVDTSLLLDVIDGVEGAVGNVQELEAESVPLVIPSWWCWSPTSASGR